MSFTVAASATSWNRRFFLMLVVIATYGLTRVAAAPTAHAQAEETVFPRPTMQAVFEQIKVLVPLSLNEERWRSPAAREEIRTALERLEEVAADLEKHGRSREAGFDALTLNLSQDLRETYERYKRGRFEESRFFFAGTMQTCVACHIRLPADRDVPFTAELTNRAEFEKLDPRERARLLVMVRRFDEALATWESLIRDQALSASQLDAGGVLSDYLNVAVRVRGEIDRASKELARFAARPDLPVYLRRRVQEWRVALEDLNADDFRPDAPASLHLGTGLAREAGHVSNGPYGRDGLVQDLAAASQLVRWLESDQKRRNGLISKLTREERQNLAMAYYWLGVVEARSLDGFWTNLSERHLEAAIRSDPKGPLAEKAYSLLEETQVLGYGGSSGVHLPTDVWNLLRDLRELMGVES